MISSAGLSLRGRCNSFAARKNNPKTVQTQFAYLHSSFHYFPWPYVYIGGEPAFWTIFFLHTISSSICSRFEFAEVSAPNGNKIACRNVWVCEFCSHVGTSCKHRVFDAANKIVGTPQCRCEMMRTDWRLHKFNYKIADGNWKWQF